MRKAAALCEAFGMSWEPHGHGGTLYQAANLHVQLATRDTLLFELPIEAGAEGHFDTGTTEVLRIDADGFVHGPQRPGLGLPIDWDQVAAGTELLACRHRLDQRVDFVTVISKRRKSANLTLSVDEQIVQRARTTAAGMGLSLNQAVRNYLSELAGQSSPALGTVARGFRSGAVRFGRFTTKSGVVTDQHEGEGGRGSDGCRRRVRRECRG